MKVKRIKIYAFSVRRMRTFLYSIKCLIKRVAKVALRYKVKTGIVGITMGNTHKGKAQNQEAIANPKLKVRSHGRTSFIILV